MDRVEILGCDSAVITRVEILAWYWDVITASNDAIGNNEHEYYEGLEEWRQALKSEAGL